MNDRDSLGAAVIVLTAEGLAMAALYARLGDTLAGLSDILSNPRLFVVAVALGLVVVGLLLVRRGVVGRALGRRARVQMVPTDAFDPSIEAVTRFAAGLARTRRVVFGL